MITQIGDAFERFADAVAKLIEAIERAVQSSGEGVRFLADRRKRRRLKQLLQKLIELQYDQSPLPWLMRAYCRKRDPKFWAQAQGVMRQATEIVVEMLALLEKDTGDFVVQAREAYRTVLFGLRDRKKLYDFFLTAPPPATEEEFAALIRIADAYDCMIADIITAQVGLATFLTSGRQGKLVELPPPGPPGVMSPKFPP